MKLTTTASRTSLENKNDVACYYTTVGSTDEQVAMEATSRICNESFLKKIVTEYTGFPVKALALKKIKNIPFLEIIQKSGGNLSPWIKMRITQLQTNRVAA